MKENAEEDTEEDKVAEGGVEMDGDQNMEEASHGPETFDISGSPASDRQDGEQLEDRGAHMQNVSLDNMIRQAGTTDQTSLTNVGFV